jgi:hypothetical protein
MAIRRRDLSNSNPSINIEEQKGKNYVPEVQVENCNILSEIRKEIVDFENSIKTQINSSYESVKKYLGFMDFIAKPAYDNLVKFYTTAVANLIRLEELAKVPGADTELRKTLIAITNYLKKKNALIPRTYGGILSQTDRAYIIHAQLMKLNVSKKISFSDFPHNSTLIFTVVNVLVVILGRELMGSIANTSDNLSQNYYSTADSSQLFQFENPVASAPRSGFIEDQMAETAAKLGGFGDINFHQSPSYD